MGLDTASLVLRFVSIEAVVQSLPPLDVAVVFGIILLAFALFVTEFVPMDVTAITVLVLLVILEPWTQISVADGFAGFSNHATLTVLALFIVSDAVRQTGVLRTIGAKIVEFAGNDERKQVGLIMGLSGSTAGIVNNTPVVAVLIPMVTDIAERTGTSPSKLLIPLSYAAMMGGMLTLIGTAPNLIASEVSARLLDRPYTMFEFTTLGAIQLVAGSLFVIFVGRHLIPERITPGQSIVDRFDLTDYLTEVVIYRGEDVTRVRSPSQGLPEDCVEDDREPQDVHDLTRRCDSKNDGLSTTEQGRSDKLSGEFERGVNHGEQTEAHREPCHRWVGVATIPADSVVRQKTTDGQEDDEETGLDGRHPSLLYGNGL